MTSLVGPFNVTVQVSDEIITLCFTREGGPLLTIELSPMQARNWSNVIGQAVDIWKERLLRDVEGTS
jgi:hypothetical protein